MAAFLVQYRLPLPDDKGGFISAYVPFEADTIQLAQREVERVIGNSDMQEAVLFQAVKVTRASRVVNTSEVNGQKVVIGSALIPTPDHDAAA